MEVAEERAQPLVVEHDDVEAPLGHVQHRRTASNSSRKSITLRTKAAALRSLARWAPWSTSRCLSPGVLEPPHRLRTGLGVRRRDEQRGLPELLPRARDIGVDHGAAERERLERRQVLRTEVAQVHERMRPAVQGLRAPRRGRSRAAGRLLPTRASRRATARGGAGPCPTRHRRVGSAYRRPR